jgi:hypothetical protein
LQLDARKQPMLFPLEYTIVDVEDILPPGNYLLDAVDKNGELLGVTIGVALGMPRNAESIDPDNENNVPMVVPTTLPNTTSDVRLVLEAQVRATQMAFIHNQRTLELGLRMAETLRDGVQVLASSQADWIKSLSSARGFFRNVGQVPPLEVKQLTVHTAGESGDDDDDGGIDEPAEQVGDTSTPHHWSKPFEPLIGMLATQLGPAIMAWMANQQAAKQQAPSENGADDGRPPFELREKKAAAKQAAEEQAAEETAAAARKAAAAEHVAHLRSVVEAAVSPGGGIDFGVLVGRLPPQTMAKFMQLHGALLPDEQADALQMLQFLGTETIAELLAAFEHASVEESADMLRRLLHGWRAQRDAAMRAAPKAPSSNGDGSGGANGGGGPTASL